MDSLASTWMHAILQSHAYHSLQTFKNQPSHFIVGASSLKETDGVTLAATAGRNIAGNVHSVVLFLQIYFI